ncbi:MAG: hypothetical protein EA411_01195 [Saprospirales bacterium]|nr:MAG: hypothetical protein EA411_01195 [Saprospirales bacterium]
MKTSLKVLIFAVLLSSCTSARVQYYTPDEETSNGLLEIRNPHYKNKVNFFGYSAMIGTTAGLGYLGYDNPFVKYNSDTDEVTSQGASSAVSGLAGLGVGITLNYAIGRKDKLSHLDNNYNDFSEWAEKYSRDYKVVQSRSTPSRLLLINKDAEQYYSFRNMEDVDIFLESFPNSNHLLLVCARSYENIPYAELPTLLEKVDISGSAVEKDIKLHYINQSQTLSEYITALDLYPNIKDDPYDDGIEYIGSMIDVAQYTKYFSTPDENQLIERAVNFATDFQTVKYFNTQFPSNPYFDQVILEIIQTSIDSELEELVELFPESSAIEKVKKEYILRSGDARIFIERNARYGVYDFNNSYNLSNLNDCKNFISSMTTNNKLPDQSKTYFIDSASEYLLSERYKNTPEANYTQNEFISFVRNNSNWLSKEATQYFLRKAKTQIELNENRRYLIENELDDVYKYVESTILYYDFADGEPLSLLDGFLSILADRANWKFFLKVDVTNYGNKPKKVKLTAFLNMVRETQSIWGSSKDRSQIKRDYVLNIPPNSTYRDLILEFNYQLRFRDERSIWGRNYLYYGPDKELIGSSDLVKIELEYYDSSIPASQERLRKEAEKNFAERTRGGSSGSRFMVDSRTHTVLTDERCYVDVKRLTDTSDSYGCISIFASNVSDNYISTIKTNRGRTYTYYNEKDDNFTECFNHADFPIMVSVSYTNNRGNQVRAKVRLESFYDYNVLIK